MDHRVCGAILIVAASTSTALAQPSSPEGEGAPDEGTTATAPDPAPAPAPAPAPGPAPVPAAKPAPPAAAEEPRFAWSPFGFFRLQLAVVQNDPNVAFVGRDDGFQLQNARVGVTGVMWRRARFVFSIDGAVDERQQVNVPDGELRVGLRDAFVDLPLSGELGWTGQRSTWIVRTGFFQTWVDPERQVPDVEREFVDRPIASRGVRATEGFEAAGLTPGRSLGAALRLDPPATPLGPASSISGVMPGLELAVQNGADEFSSNNDNDKPAVSLAALLRLPRGGYVVVSGRYNPRSVGELPFRRDEDDLQGSVGGRVVAGPLALAGAAVVVRTSFPTTGGPVQNAYGAHAQLTFGLGDRYPVRFGYRFGIFDPSSLLVTDRVMEHTVGGVLAVPRLRMRVQLQLTHVVEQAARTLSNSRAQLAAEVRL